MPLAHAPAASSRTPATPRRRTIRRSRPRAARVPAPRRRHRSADGAQHRRVRAHRHRRRLPSRRRRDDVRTHGVNIYLDVMVKGLERLVTAGEYSQDQIEHWQKRVQRGRGSCTSHAGGERVHAPGRTRRSTVPITRTRRPRSLTPDVGEQGPPDALDASASKHYTAGNATLIIVGDFDAEVRREARARHVRRLGQGHGRQAGRRRSRSSAPGRRSSA